MWLTKGIVTRGVMELNDILLKWQTKSSRFKKRGHSSNRDTRVKMSCKPWSASSLMRRYDGYNENSNHGKVPARHLVKDVGHSVAPSTITDASLESTQDSSRSNVCFNPCGSTDCDESSDQSIERNLEDTKRSRMYRRRKTVSHNSSDR